MRRYINSLLTALMMIVLLLINRDDARGAGKEWIRAYNATSIIGKSLKVWNNSIYFSGYFWPEVQIGSRNLQGGGSINSYHHFLAGCTMEGQILWATKTDNWAAENIAMDSIGNIYAIGRCTGMEAGQKIADFSDSTMDCTGSMLVKYSSSGVLQWIRSTNNAQAMALDVDKAGNAAITGYLTGDAYFDQLSTKGEGLFTAYYDSEGRIQWVQTAEASTGQFVKSDNRGGIYIAGYYEHEIRFGNDTLPFQGGSSDTFIAKYSADNGSVEWVRPSGTFAWDNSGPIGIFEDRVYMATNGSSPSMSCYTTSGDLRWKHSLTAGNINTDMAIDSLEQIYITGIFSTSIASGSVNMPVHNPAISEVYILQFDNEGTPLAGRQIYGTKNMDGMGIDVVQPGCIAFIGNSNARDSIRGTDTMVVTDDGRNCVIGLLSIAGGKLPTAVPTTSVSTDTVVVYSESGRIHISYALPHSSDVSIRIVDILGRTIKTLDFQQHPGSHTHTVDATGIPSGVYFAVVTISDRTVVRQISVMR